MSQIYGRCTHIYLGIAPRSQFGLSARRPCLLGVVPISPSAPRPVNTVQRADTYIEQRETTCSIERNRPVSTALLASLRSDRRRKKPRRRALLPPYSRVLLANHERKTTWQFSIHDLLRSHV